MINYSVVATTYNDELSVEQYINDIINQTVLPKEIVIADGGSRDSTVDLLRELSKKISVSLIIIDGERLNISEGYNTAIKHTSCDYIGITGLGNRYENDFFERLIDGFVSNNIDGTYAPIRGLDTNCFAKEYNKSLLHGDEGLRLEIPSNHGALIKKKVFEELDYFYEDFIYAGEDAEFYLLAKNSGYHFNMVLNANVRWETPTNFNELKKQVKAYSIAELQIHAEEQIELVQKNFVKLCFCGALGGVLLFGTFSSIPVLFKIILYIMAFLVGVYFRHKLNIFHLLYMYLQIYYTLGNRQYGEEKYSVKR